MAFYINVKEEAGSSQVKVLVNQSDFVKAVKGKIKKKMKLQDDDIIHMTKVKDNVKLDDEKKMSNYSVMAGDLFSIKVVKPIIVPDSETSEFTDLPGPQIQPLSGEHSKDTKALKVEGKKANINRRHNEPTKPSTPLAVEAYTFKRKRGSMSHPNEKIKEAQKTALTNISNKKISIDLVTEEPISEKSDKEDIYLQSETSMQNKTPPLSKKELTINHDSSDQITRTKLESYETQSAIDVTNANPTCNGCDERPFTAPATLSSKLLRSSSESNLANLENAVMERAVRSAMSSRPSSCSLDKNDDVERKVPKCIDRSTMVTPSLAETQLEDKEERIREVLDKFSIDIIEAGLDPDIFAERLHSRGLITKLKTRDVQTCRLPGSTKTINILHAVSGYLKTTRKPKDVLKAVCSILVQEPSTRPIVSKIEHYLDIPQQALGSIPSPVDLMRRPPSNIKMSSSSAKSKEPVNTQSSYFKRVQGCDRCRIQMEDASTVILRLFDQSSKWYILGTLLNVPIPVLDKIRGDSHLVEDCFTQMINHWLQHDPCPSWQVLTDFLIEPFNLRDKAFQLKNEFCYECCFVHRKS